MTQPLSVLIVDDDPDIRTIIELALLLDPLLTSTVASSPSEALGLIGNGLRPDGIVLDMMMPEMDGSALFQVFAGDPAMRCTPVVFITARSQSDDVEGYLAQGAAGVIAKPFDPVTLAAQIRALIERPRGG